MSERRWLRPALIVLAVPNLITGFWAVFAPQSFYDSFPGWAPRLVSAYPPFNEHLVTDAGSGFVATGVAAAVAALWLRRDVVVVAMIVYLAFSLPHTMFHLVNPSELMSTSEDVTNGIALVAGTLLASAVLVTVWPLAEERTGRNRQ